MVGGLRIRRGAMKPRSVGELAEWSQELEDQWNDGVMLVKRDQVLGWRARPVYDPRLISDPWDHNLTAWGRSELYKRNDR